MQIIRQNENGGGLREWTADRRVLEARDADGSRKYSNASFSPGCRKA